MNIGVPKETASDNRVGITPDGVGMLVGEGHTVYVESKAGLNSGFSDEEYLHAGAKVVYSAEEAWGRADIVTKVRAPVQREFPYLRDGQVVTGFLHLAVAPKVLLETLLHKDITAIAYETIQDEEGRLPVVIPMSEIAGRMTPLVAGQLLMNTYGGRGILLGGVPGIPTPEVVIVGGGVVGYNAAKSFLGLGVRVTILDNNPVRLRELDDRLGGRVSLMLATAANLERMCRIADVLVGCILIPGERAPRLITRQMVRSMKPRSLIMDVSIDQGGCIEGSRPTTPENPTYIEDDIIHYCVPNMSSSIARTASHTLTYAALPYISLLARVGLLRAVHQNAALAKGVMISRGMVISPAVASVMGVQSRPLASLFKVETT